MRSFMLSLPGKFQTIFVIGITLMVAFTSATLFGLFFDEHQLVANTDLISSVYEVMGTVYAILLTFTLWGVWQNFTAAGTSVQSEAYALLDLVHMVEVSVGEKNNTIKETALAYAKLVVEQEWSMLKNFTNSMINLREQNNCAARAIIHAVQNIIPKNERETVIFQQTLMLLTNWLDARRTRLLIARGNSAKALWPLLFTGALVLFAFHGLFIAKSLTIWIALLFGTSLVIGVTFYLIFSLDCPFAGTLSIDSEPFDLAINLLNKDHEKNDELFF